LKIDNVEVYKNFKIGVAIASNKAICTGLVNEKKKGKYFIKDYKSTITSEF
jgi:hypothetical protein